MNIKSVHLIVAQCLLVLVFLASSCQTRSNNTTSVDQQIPEEANTFYTIPFADIVENKREVPMSEFAESVEFIQFETSEKSLLGHIHDIQITKGYIFLHHNGIGLLTQYTRDGKFVRHFGALGRGPKEYALMRIFSIDEENELVYIQTNWTRKIMVYNFDGEFVRTVRFNAIERMNVIWSRDSLFVSYGTPFFGNEPYIFMEHNELGDTLQTTANYIYWDEDETSHFIRTFWGQNTFYRFNDKLHMKSVYNDSVYSYNEQNEIVPKFFINLEKHRIPDDLVYERKSSRAMPKDSKWIGVHETSNYVFIPYGYHSNIRNGKQANLDKGCVLYSKNTKEGVAVNENSFGGFINDLSSGPDFKPIYTTDTKAYAAITALDMKMYLESEEFELQSAKFPEQKEKLVQINKTLKEDDNHFLMVVNLK